MTTKIGIKNILLLTIAVVILALLAFYGYAYAVSPAAIRQPQLDHFHFRMQLIINGKSQNFASSNYQTKYEKGICSADIPKEPIHFHDDKDQLVHVHWKNITGGEVLKYYGWNLIGGLANSLGYRFDQLPKIQNMPIHGSVLPKSTDQKNLFIYSGDKDGYKKRSVEEFKTQPLEQFFNRKSNFPNGSSSGSAAPGDDELTRINNFIGNVVIFDQSTEPSAQQIKDKFNQLTPLSNSVCGG